MIGKIARSVRDRLGVGLLLIAGFAIPACQGTAASQRLESFRYRVLRPITDPATPQKPRYLRSYAGYNYGPDRPRKRDLINSQKAAVPDSLVE